MRGPRATFDKWIRENAIVPTVPIEACPIATTLQVVGKKWSLLIVRDIAMEKQTRFTELLRSVEGITKRVLSMRLRELEKEGIVMRTVNRSTKPATIKWELTDKGWDALPILMSFFGFGAKWYSRSVFRDKKPKELVELFPQKQLRSTYVNLQV
jgi:DNA-binding HxlR family transcriptional regulator